MNIRKNRTLSVLALMITMLFVFTSVAGAALPKNIYYEDVSGQVVKADYDTALNKAIDEGDTKMFNKLKDDVFDAQDKYRKIIIETADNKIINWAAASSDYKSWVEAQQDSSYEVPSAPAADKELKPDGSIGDPVAKLEIVSVGAINDVTVAFGTAKEDLVLPETVTLELSNETTKDVAVTWTCEDYDGTVAAEYTFVGSYELPEGVTGEKPAATVKVIVAADPEAPVAPVVTGVEDGLVTKEDVTPVVEEVEGVALTVELKKDDVVVEGYELGTAITEEGEYVLTVVATKATNELTAETVVNFVIDKTAPEVKEVKFADYKTIEVTFTEEVEGIPVVKLGGTELKAEEFNFADGVITIAKKAGYAAGTYKVEVSGLKDKAGNELVVAEKELVKDAPVVAKANILTEKLAEASSVVTLEAVDQYGQEISVVGLTVKAFYGTMPIDTKTVEAGSTTVTIASAALIKDREIRIEVYTQDKDGKDVLVGEKPLVVVKETAKAASIASVERTDANKAKAIKAGDTIELTASILDQFGNSYPLKNTDTVKEKLTWTTSDKSVVAFSGSETADFKEGIAGDAKINLVAKANGNATITAYLPDGSASESIDLAVVDGELALIEVNVTDFEVTNKAAVEKANILVNTTEGQRISFLNKTSEGNLIPVKADSVEFEIVAPTGFETTDINVNPVVDENGNLTGLIVTSDRTALSTAEKAGNYGEGVEYTVKVKSNVEGVAEQSFTVTSKIDNVVTVVETATEVTFRANNKAENSIVFYNAKGEVINVLGSKVDIVPDNELTYSKLKADDKGVYSVAENTDLVKGIGFTSTTKGNYSAVVKVDGKLLKTIAVTVTDASTLNKIELGNDFTVVSGDEVAKLVPFSLLDQDGKEMKLAATDLELTAKAGEASYTAITIAKYNLDPKGNIVEVTEEAEYKGLAIKVDTNAEGLNSLTEDTLITVQVDNKATDETKLIKDTVNVMVKAARVVKTIELAPETTKLAVGGTATLNIVTKDQYGDLIKVETTDLTVDSATTDVLTVGTVSEVKDTKGNVIGYKVTVTAVAKGSSEVTVTSTEVDTATAKVTFTVDAAGNLVDSVAISTKGIKDLYSTEGAAKDVQLSATAKDAAGNSIPGTDLVWSVVEILNAKGEPATGVSVDTAGKVTAVKDFVGSATIEVMAVKAGGATTTDTITLNFDNAPSAAVMSTLMLIDADEEEVTELEISEATTVTLVAKDQYGEKFTFLADTVQILVGDKTIVTATEASGKITITPVTGVTEGTTTVIINYNGMTFTIPVTVTGDAVLAGIKTLVGDNADVTRDGLTITATIADGSKNNYLAEELTIQNVVAAGLYPECVKINEGFYTIEQINEIKDALVKLTGADAYESITLGNLVGKTVYATLNGVEYTLIAK